MSGFHSSKTMHGGIAELRTAGKNAHAVNRKNDRALQQYEAGNSLVP
ncbi:MAG: hypothetical protein WBG54_22750 [Acidobacteriaceae bacterium]